MRCKETAKKIPAKNFKIDSNPQKGNHDREPLRERTTSRGTKRDFLRKRRSSEAGD